MKWKYFVMDVSLYFLPSSGPFYVDERAAAELQERITPYGEEGWELISLTEKFAVFKKQISE